MFAPCDRLPAVLTLVVLATLLPCTVARADLASASASMEDPANPLVRIDTSVGAIFLELFPGEAPASVARFLALAAGTVEIVDAATGATLLPRYYDGVRFHRVLPGFLIQAGSPFHHPLGAPEQRLPDEIDADFLGLDRQAVLNPDGSLNPLLNIGTRADFEEQILEPLYLRLGIRDAATLLQRQGEVLRALQELSVKDAYENQGYRYRSTSAGRAPTRGTVGLANRGPGTGGPEFFIILGAADWLAGRYTMIGKVVAGMEVADTIGATAIDPLQPSLQAVLVQALREVEPLSTR